jgi:ribosomal-protein-alanine N-acetyltransferase
MSSAAPVLPLTLAQAGGDDLDSVMAVMAVAFDSRFGEAWTRAQCAGILPMSGVRLTLARLDGKPVGFTLMRHVADEAELLLIAVDPDARGRGVGTALLQRFIADAGRAGCSKLHLEVRDGNKAVNLYARLEFKVQGRRSKYYRGQDGSLFDALTMARPA